MTFDERLSPPLDHMYIFEGVDYSRDPSSEDRKIFDRLLEEQLAEIQKAVGEGRALRHKAGVRFLNQFTNLNLRH